MKILIFNREVDLSGKNVVFTPENPSDLIQNNLPQIVGCKLRVRSGSGNFNLCVSDHRLQIYVMAGSGSYIKQLIDGSFMESKVDIGDDFVVEIGMKHRVIPDRRGLLLWVDVMIE